MSVPVNTMPDQTLPKPTLKEYRQKLMTINARIRNREQAIKRFRKHLKNDTFPKRMKSIKPYLKMEYPESRTMVNAASDQVQSVILVCMLQEEEKKLIQDQDSYQTLLKQRQCDRQRLIVKKPKRLTISQLQQELAKLQEKYTQLTAKLETPSE